MIGGWVIGTLVLEEVGSDYGPAAGLILLPLQICLILYLVCEGCYLCKKDNKEISGEKCFILVRRGQRVVKSVDGIWLQLRFEVQCFDFLH